MGLGKRRTGTDNRGPVGDERGRRKMGNVAEVEERGRARTAAALGGRRQRVLRRRSGFLAGVGAVKLGEVTRRFVEFHAMQFAAGQVGGELVPEGDCQVLG